MAEVRVLVLRAAGSNCDEETAFAFERAGASADRVHVNRLHERPALLEAYQVLAIPGGFTYGDDLGAGTVLANELVCRLRDQLAAFLDSGRLMIGICNGFQVLVKTGFLPALPEQETKVPGRESEDPRARDRQATLAWNLSARFEDRWVRLVVPPSKCVFTRGLPAVIELPVAHGEGRFMTRDEGTLQRLVESGQVVFQYGDAAGRPTEEYPANPNGSPLGIAGVCDPTGRVLGLMPHPERYVQGTHHPRWTRDGAKAEGDGLAIFRNAVAHFG
jgi:phosphoribosylformylglycinamidine synthase I